MVVLVTRRNKISKLQLPMKGVEERSTILFVFVIITLEYNLNIVHPTSEYLTCTLSRHATEEGRFIISLFCLYHCRDSVLTTLAILFQLFC